MKPCTAQGAGAAYGELDFPSDKTNYLTNLCLKNKEKGVGKNFKNLRK